MICIKIMGGQGNQMYQYALGRYLSLKCNCKLEYEMSYFKEKDARDFVLDKFSTVGEPSNNLLIKLYGLLPRGKHFLAKFMPIICEKRSRFQPEIKKLIKQNILLSGYWASPKYFNEIKDILYEDFTCKIPLSENTLSWRERIREDRLPTVSVHIRRGDYIKSEINRQIYMTMPLEYYRHCLNELVMQFGKLSIYVFSNDLDWVKDNMYFGDNLVHYVTGNDEHHGYEDMILMWECKHHVIANSTFSWWGAYLSKQSGEVYAPSEWYNINTEKYDIKDLYPIEWKKVKVN